MAPAVSVEPHNEVTPFGGFRTPRGGWRRQLSRACGRLPIARPRDDAATNFNRRPARADGRARGFRLAHHGREPARVPRARTHRARGGIRALRRRGNPVDALPDPLERAAEAFRAEPAARLRVLDAGSRALPRQRLLPARGGGRGLPSHPAGDQDDGGAATAGRPPHAGGEAARPRARHRPDRLRQVDDARGDHRRDQPHPLGAHPHRRGSDRVRPPPQEVHRQPARDRP